MMMDMYLTGLAMGGGCPSDWFSFSHHAALKWRTSCTSQSQIRSWTYLQLLLVHLHLLQLVPDGLHVPGPVVSLQVVKLQVTEAFLQFLEGVTKLKN